LYYFLPHTPKPSVVVYRNGDPFHTGRRFVVNQRQVATMEAFLNEVTRSIRAPLAVRTLYTPKQGHRVTDLQDLQTGAQYVAAGSERFKKLEIKNKKLVCIYSYLGGIRLEISDWFNQTFIYLFFTVICFVSFSVFRNGDLLCAPLRFLIPRSMRQDLEQILCVISEKVNLRTGAVRRSETLQRKLETGHCYVAVGTERFKKLPYEALLASKERYFKSVILLTRYMHVSLTIYLNIFQKEEQKSNEEPEGAEEVQEDENTATELPVDQVSFNLSLGVKGKC
uniref:Doublecortin domain containing 2B n=1 Tax=Oryzias sinensis TaxID=183150 RepID=A0A8C7ZML4_9TELE